MAREMTGSGRGMIDPRTGNVESQAYTEHSLIGCPSPSGSVATALDDLARRGFEEHFAVEAGRLRGLGSGRLFDPEELVIREHHRFEGTSDPDDMAVVYALESRSGVRGTLVDAYGVYSSPAISAVMSRIPASRRAPG
jgi:hypothetical protein